MLDAQRSQRWNRAAAVACALVALVAVVALAGRAPLDRSAPVNASSAGTPLTALCVLLAGGGLVALCALTVFLWPDRKRRDDEPEHERPPLQVHWAWKVAAITLPFALGAALIGAAARRWGRAPTDPASAASTAPDAASTAPDAASAALVARAGDAP
jgi:hypothetical protein